MDMQTDKPEEQGSISEAPAAPKGAGAAYMGSRAFTEWAKVRGFADSEDVKFAVREFYQEEDIANITAAQVVDWMWWIDDNDRGEKGTTPDPPPPPPPAQDDGTQEELFGGYVGGGRGGRGDE